jgi:hypothetical protein
MTEIRTLLKILPHCALARMWRAWMLFENIPKVDEDDAQDTMEREEILDLAVVGHIMHIFRNTQTLLRNSL